MTHVVERCPSCGVEHDVSEAGACEACREPLRYWCRRHGRDAGWLAGPDCPRCAAEAVRAAPAPRPPAPPAPAPSAPPLPPRPAPPFIPVRRGRTLSEILGEAPAAAASAPGRRWRSVLSRVALGVTGVICAGGLLLSLLLLVTLPLTDGFEGRAPLVLGIVCGFVGSLAGLAVVVDAHRQGSRDRDRPA